MISRTLQQTRPGERRDFARQNSFCYFQRNRRSELDLLATTQRQGVVSQVSVLEDQAVLSDQTRASAEPDATDQLEIQLWYRRVYALCRSRLISVADCEEATQETFLRAITHNDELKNAGSLGAWLRRIARNVCVDKIRRKQVRKAESLDQHAAYANENGEVVEQKDHADYLLGLIDQLPEVQREVVFLHYYDNMSYDEMADWLGVARSTVNDRLGKARQALKGALVSTENDP